MRAAVVSVAVHATELLPVTSHLTGSFEGESGKLRELSELRELSLRKGLGNEC